MSNLSYCFEMRISSDKGTPEQISKQVQATNEVEHTAVVDSLYT